MVEIEALHAAEAHFIQQLQSSLGLGFRIPMQIISLFASEAFIISIVPAVYWCIHRRKGAELGLLILGSTFINLWIKQLLAWPRPYEIIPSIGLAYESTYGMPSGHSQLSVVFWAYAVQFFPKKWRIPVLVGAPLLVGFSRIYLGVHFPSDVLGGYLIGIVFFVLFRLLSPPIEKMLQNSGIRLRIILAVAVSFIMNVLSPKDTLIAGAFLGAAVGFAFASGNIPIDQTDGFRKKILRYLVGLVGTSLIYFVLKFASAPLNTISHNNQEQLIRFVRYAIIGGWVSYGAPFLFLKLKLARRES